MSSRLVLGCMRIESLDDEAVRSLVGAALDAGITVFDHADIYGSTRHACEQRFGEAVRFTPAQREQVVVQSKVGIREGYYDFSREHVERTVDESLTALRVDHLDVLLLHRPDALADPTRPRRPSSGWSRRGRSARSGSPTTPRARWSCCNAACPGASS